MSKNFPTPKINEFEMTASSDGRQEKLTPVEFELLSQLLRYPEEVVGRESLKQVSGAPEGSVSDRKLDRWMSALIRKTNALYPAFPVVRFSPPDGYVYTESAPKRRRVG